MDLKRKKMGKCMIMLALALHNAILEGPELFGPPKILAQLRLCIWIYIDI